MVIVILCSLFSTLVSATTFKLMTVQQQLEEADGIFIGHYLQSKAIKLEDDRVVTQMIFKMNREFGLQSDWFGQDEVIIHYPGGKLGDTHVSVLGVPTFLPGEKVAVLIKSVDNRYWGLNLGFGSFKIINYGKDTLLLNTLFPNEPSVGQMEIGEFETLVKRVKKASLKTVLVPQEKYLVLGPEAQRGRPQLNTPASAQMGNYRAIASSTKEGENSDGQPDGNDFWLLAVFTTLGVLYRVSRQKDVG